ncbi:coiled-coil domain-containing protein 125 [Centroberyx gerrardi]|uniref:coiled-coil domain-containing protein 125 n=1 Tax=Centroberyx gerrardi TaxID=166262 RepID=UPI003AAE5C5B
MQGVREAGSLEDDMADGDLGDGTGIRPRPSSTSRKSRSASWQMGNLLPGTELLQRGSQVGDAAWTPRLDTGFSQVAAAGQRAALRLTGTAGSLDDLSKEELRERLQEANEVAELLRCELEVAHRYLEGKYEALKILQGKAILDKATSHTKSLLQKSEERAKALEKEVNSLQWELTFNQVQMKKFEQFWEQKYNRISSENKTLTDSLEERGREVQQLRAENTALSQQCLELLSMLSVKEQRAFQGTKPPYSLDREGAVLELAVLGACQCPGFAEACPCSRTAAASRKQLLQLRQELDAQRRRRDEALMVADAFRIAFEQQLRKRSEHFLMLAEANMLKSHQHKSEGANRSSLIGVSQRLRGLLPPSFEVKITDDPIETLYRLLDLLNDKEEALAHQRKVSIMLARSAEELQRQLHLDSKCQPQHPPEPSESKIQPQQTPDPSQSKIHPQQPPGPSESQIQPQQPPDLSECQSQPQQLTDPSESQIQAQQLQDPSESKIQLQQPPDPSDSKIQAQEPTDSKPQP